MQTRANVIIFLGPPGSGKGTQAAQLAAELGIPAISTGEMLRRECQSGSELGKAVQSVLASGQLVSDELINQVVSSRLAEGDCDLGCILDGYPRTVRQARFLNRLLRKLKRPRPVVFDFEIACEDVIARLSRRRQCTECGRIFSVDPHSQNAELVCERDGSKLIERSDDQPTVIRERLALYGRNAGELVHYYARQNYHRISAARMPQEVSDELLAIMGRRVAAAAAAGGQRLSARPRYQAQPA